MTRLTLSLLESGSEVRDVGPVSENASFEVCRCIVILNRTEMRRVEH